MLKMLEHENMPTVLFLCSGNYYRSRFAEVYFNRLAEQQPSAWRADSRGLALDPANPGPISRHALEAGPQTPEDPTARPQADR
jgi:protein-tyrosine phosphatase